MTYRVIQWGTGNVGTFALGAILDHPELELAGVWVHNAAKVGQDAGVLSGRPPVGIAATNDADALLALGADCVCYAASTDLRPVEGVQEICRWPRAPMSCPARRWDSSIQNRVPPRYTISWQGPPAKAARQSSSPGSIPDSSTTSYR
jgi:hypothetical protein